ncbi:MAG: hypothetical protein KA419_11320 [Acidobacteria bacterium]|nr:hypothetical protein [Acidobacteriota bacterium]
MSLEVQPILVPSNRLTVTEHVRIFCESANYPMEICLDQDPFLVQQHEVYNHLLQGIPFAIDSRLMCALGPGRDDEPLPEPGGGCVVLDGFNCFQRGETAWHPARFRFTGDTRDGRPPVRGLFEPDPGIALRWDILLRFLRTFFPHRLKFTLYRSAFPAENFYLYLKALSAEFRAVPSNELEMMNSARRNRYRVGDELVRRQVLSLRV